MDSAFIHFWRKSILWYMQFKPTIHPLKALGSASIGEGGVVNDLNTSFTFTGRAQSFEWVNRGFKLHIPEDALPPEVNECRIHIKTSLSGQFQFPEDMELVSGIYWIATPHDFMKPVTVEIQHCSSGADHPSSLTYIIAKCTQEDLPYKFNTLNGGVFAPSSRYGSIILTHFSGVGIASRSPRRQSLIQRLVHRRPQVQSEISSVKSYCARLYYSSSGILSWEVYFAIMWNLELHISVSYLMYFIKLFHS